jgi:SulP family sulfate permease
MTRQVVAQLRQEFHPSQLLPSLTAGLIAGVLTIIIEISFAAMIFSGDLSEHISSGIGVTLFGALAIGIVTALTSSFPGVVALPQDNPAAILALMGAAVVSSMPASATPEDTFLTVIAAIVITSLFTGAFFLALGLFKLGGLIRYMPYPVIGGFLAGTGWLLIQGAMGVMADASFSLSQLPYLLQSDVLIKWLPGLVFAVLLMVVLRRYSHFLIIPSMLLVAIGLFYVLLWLTNSSVAEASAQGWLLGPFPEGALWQPLTLSVLDRIHWSVIFGQAGTIGTVLIISVISLLLNASGLELTARRDIDLNRELQSSGIANLVAGLGGGPAGYHALSLSALGHMMGSNSRLVGLFSSLLCGVMLFLGASILSLFPKPVLGGLILFLGLAFLVEWVYDAWFKLPKAEYAIVILILIVINTVGVLEGVGLGMVLAVVLFVVNYSRIGVSKHTLSGTNFQSNVVRPRLYQQLLRQKGHWIYIIELQGFLFFGTANRLLDQVRERINTPDLPVPHFVVLDFRQVNGLDASAALSFAKMKQVAQAEQIVLVFTHLSPKMQRLLEREVLTAADKAVWRTFTDLDHGIEWCEEQMIQIFESVGLSAKPKSVKRQLEEFLPKSTRLSSLFDDFIREDKGQITDREGAIRVASLEKYMEQMDVDKGYYLIRQGDTAKGLFFIEAGGATVQLEYQDGKIVRLRKMGAGTVVGEVGLYLGAQATASVITDQPSTVYYVSADSLKQMEEVDPAVAAAFHKFIAQILSERLSSTTATVKALLK